MLLIIIGSKDFFTVASSVVETGHVSQPIRLVQEKELLRSLHALSFVLGGDGDTTFDTTSNVFSEGGELD